MQYVFDSVILIVSEAKEARMTQGGYYMFIDYNKNEKVIELAKQQQAEEKYAARIKHYQNRIEELSAENEKLAEELSAENKLAILENEKELSIIYLTFDICSYRQLYESLAEELRKEKEEEEKTKIEELKQKQQTKNKEKRQQNLNVIIDKLKNLKEKTIIDGICDNPFLIVKGIYKVFKNNNLITIKEKNKNILKDASIFKASEFLLDKMF